MSFKYYHIKSWKEIGSYYGIETYKVLRNHFGNYCLYQEQYKRIYVLDNKDYTIKILFSVASEHNIHPAIYSYIAYKKGETLRSKYDGEKPNADPRKWEMASKMLYATGSPEMLRALVGEAFETLCEELSTEAVFAAF